MSNGSTISWVGNRVFDPNTPPQSSQSVRMPAADTMQSSPVMPPLSQPQGGPVMPPFTQPQGGAVTFDTQTQQGPPPSTERGYIPYYLASNIGKNVRAEFIIGSNQYADKTGRLIEVGISYFVLDDINSRTHVMCDLYSVKFVTVLQF